MGPQPTDRAGGPAAAAAPTGLLLVDKPSGPTSHDVVGRVRAILGTRRVGHAGTLDPLATGLLVIGVGRATKLLGHLSLRSKSYTATVRLGVSTDTDDADGQVTATVDATGLSAGDIAAGMARLTGEFDQVPSSVSAVKVDGTRAYARVRAGETVELAARRVTVGRFDITAPPRRTAAALDVDVAVECSTGTYVRALARDLGATLGVGGHLTVLRRETVGPFRVAGAADVYPDGVPPRGGPRPAIDDGLRERLRAAVLSVDDAARAAFPTRTLDAGLAGELRYGRAIPAAGLDGVYAALDAAGRLVALMADRGEQARPVLVWQAAG